MIGKLRIVLPVRERGNKRAALGINQQRIVGAVGTCHRLDQALPAQARQARSCCDLSRGPGRSDIERSLEYEFVVTRRIAVGIGITPTMIEQHSP